MSITYVDKNKQKHEFRSIIPIYKDILLDIIYPVGSIYISVNNTNPKNFIGGEWERFSNGRCIVGVDESDTDFNSSSKSGGSKTANISHTHSVPAHNHGLNSHTHTLNAGYANIGYASTYIYSRPKSISITSTYKVLHNSGYTTDSSERSTVTSLGGKTDAATGSTANSAVLTSGSAGSTSLSKLQPYITCYIWKRTS